MTTVKNNANNHHYNKNNILSYHYHLIPRAKDGELLTSNNKWINLTLPTFTAASIYIKIVTRPSAPFNDNGVTNRASVHNLVGSKRDVFPEERGLLQFVVISIK